ncbi:MAG: GTPase ObgE [Firmicutes bacterium]|jgi:GTP-binding protein|nr:GTPase ObgE [Bacillota bacterium]
MFVDEARIRIEAGRGGDGAVAFRREKYVPRGGPSGGDGGKGGDVVLRVDAGLSTLMDFRHETQFRAPSGDSGGPSNRSGRQGEDLYIAVPPGTMVMTDDGRLLADLTTPGQTYVAARGGRGGRGNARFASSTHRVPRMAERGQPGEELFIRLELTLLADVGLVGFPNAGKSTLISRVSAARPRVADYPFTTLVPNLGVVARYGAPFVIADVPGLIEGAHEGAGLGHAFLRHLKRTRLLLHLVDCSPFSGRDPVADYETIRGELEAFSTTLRERPEIVVGTKQDLTGAHDRLLALRERLAVPVFGISAVTGQGVAELMGETARRLREIPVPETDLPMPVVEPRVRGLEVARDDGAWRLLGDAEERASMTQWGNLEAEEYLAEYLRRRGAGPLLRRAGVEDGARVQVGPGLFIYAEGSLMPERLWDRLQEEASPRD